jgi:hypothetical protein
MSVSYVLRDSRLVCSRDSLKESCALSRIFRMNESSTPTRAGIGVLGLSFILGMALFAWLLGHAARSYKRLDEYVTVKGLSEREVPANFVVWPVTFALSEETLGKLQEKLVKSREIVHAFLKESGFETTEISNSPPNMREVRPTAKDKDDAPPPPPHYEATVTVLLRTTKVAMVKTALETCDKLVQQGILLSSSRAQFLFTGLNEIKPAMIQEANRNARIAAEKFAGDSGSHVGRIRHAVQGPFEVEDVDDSSPDRKSVRVVTTVDLYLE